VIEYPPLTRLTQDEILEALQRALLAEQQAVIDYHRHAQASDRPGIREALEALRDVEREHALRLLRRIEVLGGQPARAVAEPQPIGEDLSTSLVHDLRGEQWAIVEYARLVAGIMDDDETATMMAELLLDEIQHAAWLRATLRAIQGGA
jgi:bacterioferritin (cytochrome b1)